MDLYELLYGKPSTGWNEEEFRRWYSEKAGKLGLSPDPDDPEHFYDYRAAFRAGASPDASGHWPSQFKLPGHPREIIGGVNTRTGKPAPTEIPLRGPLGGLGAAFSTTAGLPPTPSTPEPSISRDIVMKSAADLGRYGVGAAETASMLASGLFYMPAAGLAGLGAAFDPVISGTGGLDWEAGNRAIEGVMEWGTYKPKTEMGMASSQLAMKPFEALVEGAEEAGGFVQEKSSPYVGEEVAAILGATTASLIEASPMLIEPAYRGLRGLGNEGALKIFGKNITKDVDVPQISGKLMYGEKLTPEDIKAFEGKATAEGLTAEDIGRVTSRLQEYNEMKNFGHDVVWLPDMGEDVIMREGVLNTPSMDPESIRRQRVDKILYPDIEKGVRSSRTGKLIEGGSETTGIPSEIRGKKLQPFLNIPATEPALQQPRPANMPDYPVVVTGNPHLVNFRRPDPSWDSSIKVVRVKPVHRGTLANHEAVVSAIKYANEVGAKVLVTNFRAKQPWTLALYTDIVPNNPKQPGFYDYWKPNPKPRPKDIRMAPDWVPYIPKGKQVREAFKRNGWKTHKELYGEGGTWWWPESKELDPRIKEKLPKDQKVEYCDLLKKGCPACRNCQKATYPSSKGAQIWGMTDEPFCEHGCPNCFVRLGQSGVGGRRGISITQNAKQAGYGDAELGGLFPNTIDILQGVARDVGGGRADYISKYFMGPMEESMDTAMSLFLDGKVTGSQLKTMQNEILSSQVKAGKYQMVDDSFTIYDGGEEFKGPKRTAGGFAAEWNKISQNAWEKNGPNATKFRVEKFGEKEYLATHYHPKTGDVLADKTFRSEKDAFNWDYRNEYDYAKGKTPSQFTKDELYFDAISEVNLTPGIEAAEDAWSGGVADLGEGEAAYIVQNMRGYFDYKSELESRAREIYGEKIPVYRAMTPEQYSAWANGEDIGPIGVTTNRQTAESWHKFALNRDKEFIIVKMEAPPESIIMRGKAEEMEIVIDGNHVSFNELETVGRTFGEKAVPQPTREKFIELADLQRGEPERAMLRAADAMGGGVMQPMVEHIGDLTHRMNERNSFFGRDTGGLEFVQPKVDKGIAYLTHRYGFAREFMENLENNANYAIREKGSTVTPEQFRANVFKKMQEYADAHRKLPVYNRAQWLAREAAISLGERRFADTLAALQELKSHMGSVEEWTRFAREGLKVRRVK